MTKDDFSPKIIATIQAIKSCDDEDVESLKKNVCPFFENGGSPDCLFCSKTLADLKDCKDVYLETIKSNPMEVWCPEFDQIQVKERPKVTPEDFDPNEIRCDRCFISNRCRYFSAGYKCAIDWGNDKPKNGKDMLDYLINMQFKRVKRAELYERIDGGVPDANLSAEMDRLHGLVVSKENLNVDRLSINVEAQSSNNGGGILAKLFGGAPAIENNKSETIDITPVQEAEKFPIEKKSEE